MGDKENKTIQVDVVDLQRPLNLKADIKYTIQVKLIKHVVMLFKGGMHLGKMREAKKSR